MRHRRAAADDKGITEPTADFPGLVELVVDEESRRVEFWCFGPVRGPRPKSTRGATAANPFWFVERVVQPGGEDLDKSVVWVPPSKKDLPWLLPRRAEVERYFTEDSNAAYFAALCDWVNSVVQFPKPEHTVLAAAWIAHTYLTDVPMVKDSPYLLALGPPGVGKTRLLEACVHAARRGILTMNVREAALIRYADDYHASLGIDTIDFMTAIKSSADFFAARTTRNGTVTTRVIDLKKGPFAGGIRHYAVFGPTMVASNHAVSDEIIGSRTLVILMRESDSSFQRPTPELALPLRERGTAFRARMLIQAANNALEDPPRVAPRRLGDIFSGLALVVRECAPKELSVLTRLAGEFAEAQRTEAADTLDVQLLRQAIAEVEQAGDPVVTMKLSDFVHNVNVERHQGGEWALSPRRVSGILRATFGIETRPGTGNYRVVTFAKARLAELATKYGLQPPGGEHVNDRYKADADVNPRIDTAARASKAPPVTKVKKLRRRRERE